MPHDSDADQAEPARSAQYQTGWRLWITSPPYLVVTVAGMTVLGLLVGYLAAVLFVFPPQNVAADLKRVPDVVGRTTDQARQRIEREGLSYEEAPGIHHGQPVGTVVAQEPLAGQMALPRSPVKVTLSLGPPQRRVPNVVGLSREQAEVVVRQTGFAVEVTRVDASQDVDQVVDTRPSPGAPLELTGTVVLLVSAGQSTVQVPDLAMQSLTEAETTLRRLGLWLGEVTEDSASLAAPGTVLAQSPAAGEEAARGARVSVTIAIAPVAAVDSTLAPADTSEAARDTAGARADTTIAWGTADE